MNNSTRKICCNLLSIHLCLILTLLAGCAHENVIQKGDVIYGVRLYANMEKRDDLYYISTISNDKNLPNPVFNLNTMLPEFDTSKGRCSDSLAANNRFRMGKSRYHDWFEECYCEKEEIFRACSLDIIETMTMQLIVGPIFIFIPNILGWNERDYYFDSDRYYQAVNDALIFSEIDRDEIVKEYNEIYNSILESKSHIENISEIHKTKVSNLVSEFEAEDRSRIKTINSNLDFNLITKDLSGFYNGVEIDFTRILLPHDYRSKINLIGEDIIISNQDIIKASPDKFILEYSKVLSEYKNREQQLKERSQKYLSELRATFEEIQKSSYTIETSQPHNTFTYNVNIDTPSQVAYTSRSISIPVIIKILSKDFGVRFPSYRCGDQNLSLDFDGLNIMLKNNTGKYLTVHTISVYHNSEIFTYEYGLQLPPSSKPKMPLKIREILSGTKILEDATYNNMTANKAKKQSVEFGFAVKYNLADQTLHQTIYSTKYYNTYNVLTGSM